MKRDGDSGRFDYDDGIAGDAVAGACDEVATDAATVVMNCRRLVWFIVC